MSLGPSYDILFNKIPGSCQPTKKRYDDVKEIGVVLMYCTGIVSGKYA